MNLADVELRGALSASVDAGTRTVIRASSDSLTAIRDSVWFVLSGRASGTPLSVWTKRTEASAAGGRSMGWLSVVATGLAVRGAVRRKQRRAAALEEAHRQDELARLEDEATVGYEIWPPEDHDGR